MIPGVCIARKTCGGPPKEKFQVFDTIVIDFLWPCYRSTPSDIVSNQYLTHSKQLIVKQSVQCKISLELFVVP